MHNLSGSEFNFVTLSGEKQEESGKNQKILTKNTKKEKNMKGN
jgi:hypothetical protein